jgi:hypothetical protein
VTILSVIVISKVGYSFPSPVKNQMQKLCSCYFVKWSQREEDLLERKDEVHAQPAPRLLGTPCCLGPLESSWRWVKASV